MPVGYRPAAVLEPSITIFVLSDSVKKYLNVYDFRARFVRPDDALARVLWDDSIKGGLPGRAFYCSVGYDC